MTSNITDRLNGFTASSAAKVPCVVATVANITLSGEQTIDGTAVTDGDRVLVRSQTDGTENGIYVVSTGSWSRAPDMDGSRDVVKGTQVYCTGGSTQNAAEWILTTANPITIGTSTITWTELFDASLDVSTKQTVNHSSETKGDFDWYDGTEWINKQFLAHKGSSIASATTTDIGAADSDYIEITGTTTITSFGTDTGRDSMWLQFGGILTLTHNGTSLILPGAANITTAAGDVAHMVRISAGNWKCVNYLRASGDPINVGTSGTTLGFLDGDNTYSGNNTHSGNNTLSGSNTFTGKLFIPDDGELTISGGVITLTGTHHRVDTEADAATDDLDTINTGADGLVVFLKPENDARSIVIKHGTGNIICPNDQDIELQNIEETITLVYDAQSSNWLVLAQSNPSGRFIDRQVFTTSGTWTMPQGTKKIIVTVVGGGGGGGGSGASTGATTGATGGTSSFGSGPFLQATGGVGGQRGTTTSYQGGEGGTGGVGTLGDENGGGQAGGAGMGTEVGGSSSAVVGGTGGSSIKGGGGYAGADSAEFGGDGGDYGGGGGGAASIVSSRAAGGGGGGGGGYSIEEIAVGSLSATETVTVGAGGAGDNYTQDGGDGADGLVIVESYS
jgi:hypothetical protein